MQAKIGTITGIIEEFCPPALAEEWDNCGLQVGDPERPLQRVLLALDMDEAVLSEAVEKEAGLVITHHPLFFKGIKQVREDRPQGRLLARIIRSGMAVYSAHTSLDSAAGGVSHVLAEILGLSEVEALRPAGEKYLKLAVFVPTGHAGAVRDAMAASGAGWIGNYSDCTFMTVGTGTFRPLQGASPFIGKAGELEKVEEIKLETILPQRIAGRVLKALLAAHPYEEVAYDLYPLENRPAGTGLGRMGLLREEISFGAFTRRVKEALGINALRAGGREDRLIRRVAVCGGSGGDLWPAAAASGADVLVTGDIGYHTARDMMAAGICFIDAGHYATERIILDPLAGYIRRRCRETGLDTGVFISEVQRDPFVFL